VIFASCERRISAPVDTVWMLVSTAEGLRRWMAVEAELDLRPGGIIRWVHDNGWAVAGRIREVVPLRRLVFTYGWESGGFPVPLGSSVVTIGLYPDGATTVVRIRHEGLTPDMAEQHTRGWIMFTERLVEAAARTPGAGHPRARKDDDP
jgi:uncharacterized protein YndB with AHSA1/START domain